MIIIVSYDLKGGKDYTPLYEAIKAQGAWWHYLTATWILSTTKTADQVYNGICGQILANDRLFVGTLAPGYEGWLAKDAWDWLKSRGLNTR
jgi:hypothetical protein